MSDDGSNQSIDSRENSNFSPPLKMMSQSNQHRFQSSALNLVSSSKFVAQLPFHLMFFYERMASTIEKMKRGKGREVQRLKEFFYWLNNKFKRHTYMSIKG